MVIRTVANLIDALGGPSAVARALSTPRKPMAISTVSEMKQTGSINVRHWPKIIALAEAKNYGTITSEFLMRLHTERRRA